MLQPLSAQTMSGLRRDIDRLGMFFGLTRIRSTAGWHPVSRLYDAADPALLARLLTVAAERVGAVEPRVAASLLYQGFASRLLSPQLACLALGECVPRLGPAAVWWRRSSDELITIGAPDTDWLTGPVPELVDHLVTTAFDAHLDPLSEAIRRQVAVAPGLLRGNASAALVSGLRLLAPHCGTDWREWARLALAHPRLADTGRLRAGEPSFIRRSCCLYYRTAHGGLCGDCPLDFAPEPSRR